MSLSNMFLRQKLTPEERLVKWLGRRKFKCGLCGADYTLDRPLRNAHFNRPCQTCSTHFHVDAPSKWRPTGQVASNDPPPPMAV
jgi:hypothetical protein